MISAELAFRGIPKPSKQTQALGAGVLWIVGMVMWYYDTRNDPTSSRAIFGVIGFTIITVALGGCRELSRIHTVDPSDVDMDINLLWWIPCYSSQRHCDCHHPTWWWKCLRPETRKKKKNKH